MKKIITSLIVITGLALAASVFVATPLYKGILLGISGFSALMTIILSLKDQPAAIYAFKTIGSSNMFGSAFVFTLCLVLGFMLGGEGGALIGAMTGGCMAGVCQ